VDANDIPDVLAKWPTRAEGSAAYRVPLAKILASDDLSLAAGRYKPVTAQAANHDAPREILAEVLALEEEIVESVTNLLGAIQK
jgi:type I restriction enzyme M protein